MAEAKWVKFMVSMFEDPKLKIINSMKNRDCICYVWVRSIMLAGLCNRNGFLCINDNIPYSLDMISIMFDRNAEDVKEAYEVLMQLEMIEISEDGIYRVKNWMKHQNIEGLEKLKKQNAERVAKYRRKKKAELEENLKKNSEKQVINKDDNERYEEAEVSECNVTCNKSNVTVMKQNKREKKKEEKKKENKEREIIDEGHNKCEDLEPEVKEVESYFKELTGNSESINTAVIKYAVLKHGSQYVKYAIDKAVEAGKTSLTYVNGILKNWAAEGYPNLSMGEGCDGGEFFKQNSDDNKSKYGQVKKKKPRELTEAERREAVNLE